MTLPARLAPLAAYLLDYAVKDIGHRNGGAPKMHDLAELLSTVRAGAASASGRPLCTLAVTADRFIPVSEAAVIAGVSERHMRRLARSGALRAVKRGRDWSIDQDAAHEYTARRHSTWGHQAA